MIKLNNFIIENGYFPDGTLNLKLPCAIGDTYNIIQWKFDHIGEQVILYNIVKHIRQLKSNNVKIDLEMFYIPNARQDRVENNEDVFTLKYFADFINDLNFDNVYVLDPHSDVSAALFNKIICISPQNLIKKVIDEVKPDVIMYPDLGATKRYAKFTSKPYLTGDKKRDWKTGKILGLDVIGNVPSKPFSVLIVDDICSYGETVLYSAKKLKELGADKIYLYVSHLENSVLEGELIDSKLIDKIYTTNSLFTERRYLIKIMKLFNES